MIMLVKQQQQKQRCIFSLSLNKLRFVFQRKKRKESVVDTYVISFFQHSPLSYRAIAKSEKSELKLKHFFQRLCLMAIQIIRDTFWQSSDPSPF